MYTLETIVRATAHAFPMLVALRTDHIVTSVTRETIGCATAHSCAKLVAGADHVITHFAYLAVAVEPRIARDTVVVVLCIACSSSGLLAVCARARVLNAAKTIHSAPA